MLYTQTVEARTLDLIKRLMQDEELKDFRLVGGTALSLCIGHRISIDIDLFTSKEFDAKRLYEHLLIKHDGEKLRSVKNGIFGLIEDIKVDLISHQYPWLKPSNEIQGIRMASLKDIGAMKVHAIVNNGSRLKDFIDVYYLLEHFSANQLISAYSKKYQDANEVVVRNSLIYFSDIDFDVPVMPVEKEWKWERIAERLKNANLNPDNIYKARSIIDKKKGKGL